MAKVMFLIISLMMGFISFNIISNPNKNIQNKLPVLKIKWIQILPNIRIHVKGNVIVLHHWMNLSLILIVTIVYGTGVLSTMEFRAAVIGGILNGFSYPDWKRIVIRK